MDAGEGNLGVSHGVFLSHGGRLWAFMGAFYDKFQRTHTRAYRLNEASGQWEPHGVVIDRGFWPMQEPQQMADGNWIMAGFRVASGFGQAGNLPAVAISKGDDFTKWNLVVIPAAPNLGSNLWGESTVIVESKRILNIARYGKKSIALLSVSEDHGRSWTPAAPSNLPMATSKPYAGTLSTGQPYLVCTTTADTGGARSPLTIAVGKPGESVFSKVFLIRTSVFEGTPGVSDPKADFSYPYVIEHKGKLYIGYTHKSHAANELAVIPIDQLRVEHQSLSQAVVSEKLAPAAAFGGGREITRIWLTHKTNDPGRIVVNWMTDEPGNSIVRFGLTKEYEQEVRVDESTTLHHVEIPVKHRDAVYHYSVRTGDHRSADATFKTQPTDALRVAVVADWQGKPNLSAIVKDDVHLLLTAGDNIARLWDKCGQGNKDCVKPYSELIDAYPQLFRSIPFMPALGNHDREIRPRGDRPPDDSVYDVEATAFRRFFELPGDVWKWQFKWYKKLVVQPPGFVVTLYNERNASVRNQAQQQWHYLFRKGTCCITGFGYFAERADVDGFPYYNTALSGKGTRYPDPHSRFLAGEDSYILLTLKRGGPMTVEIKSLKGTVLDRREFERPAARK